MLTIDGISYSYNGSEVLRSISLRLEQGQIGTLIGASGSGKTTLLKLLSGLLQSQQGAFTVDGTTPPQACSRTTFMTQEDTLLPWRTALGNLMLINELGKNKQEKGLSKEAAVQALKEVGLEGKEYAYPHELSGGMRQRVAFARILCLKRPLLLLDEPFSSIDVPLREQMSSLLLNMRERYGMTILMVTHDFRDALALSDKIYLLSDGSINKNWQVDDRSRRDPASFYSLYDAMKSACSIASR